MVTRFWVSGHIEANRCMPPIFSERCKQSIGGDTAVTASAIRTFSGTEVGSELHSETKQT